MPHRVGRRGSWYGLSALLAILVLCEHARAGEENPVVDRFESAIQPILIDYCYRCHADGMKKGGLAFDQSAPSDLVGNRDVWSAVLKNVRAGLMPPPGKPRPSDADLRELAAWIKHDVFRIDPSDPDPGRGTIRRLNRTEYRNTIRDLVGYDFKVEEEFPPDDSGYGFDNIADVLSVSPLLLEKYIQAAESIVAAGVPTISKYMPERIYRGIEFRAPEGGGNGEHMSIYKKARVQRLIIADVDGDYHLAIEISVHGSFDYDPGHCKMTARLDDKELVQADYAWQDGKVYRYWFTEKLEKGDHHLSFDIEPASKPAEPTAPKQKKNTSVDVRIQTVKFQGPMDPKHWTHPKNYGRFFPKDEPAQARPTGATTLAKFWAGLRPRPFAVRSILRRSNGSWRWRKGFIARRASGSNRAWREPWWPCSPRPVSCSASRRPSRRRTIPAGSTCRSMSTRLLRDSLISSGQRCPIRNCFRPPAATS